MPKSAHTRLVGMALLRSGRIVVQSQIDITSLKNWAIL